MAIVAHSNLQIGPLLSKRNLIHFMASPMAIPGSMALYWSSSENKEKGRKTLALSGFLL